MQAPTYRYAKPHKSILHTHTQGSKLECTLSIGCSMFSTETPVKPSSADSVNSVDLGTMEKLVFVDHSSTILLYHLLLFPARSKCVRAAMHTQTHTHRTTQRNIPHYQQPFVELDQHGTFMIYIILKQQQNTNK